MTHDVDGYSGSYYPTQTLVDNHNERRSKDEEPPTTIISRIRSLFSQPNEMSHSDHSLTSPDKTSHLSDKVLDLHSKVEYPGSSFLDMTSSTAHAQRFSDVKRLLTNLTKPTRQVSLQRATIHSRSETDGSSVDSGITGSGQSVVFQMHSTSSVSNTGNTPPLTPDSLSPSSLEGPAQFQYQYQDLQHHQNLTLHQPDIHIHEEAHPQDIKHHSPSHDTPSHDIKEGKKPQRPICYDSLIADITDEPPPVPPQEALYDNSHEEWYGLAYTLELSRRDRCGSNSGEQASAGEHSKSRESWAIIHQGTIHPFLEDEEYHHWKRWHRYLDKQDEKRKMRKAWAFMMQAHDFASCYVEERRTRDCIFLEQEQHGSVSNIGRTKEHLYNLTEHRPDPYFPRMKHGLGWHLKRSRSVGCLRELCPVPEPDEDEELPELHRVNEMDED